MNTRVVPRDLALDLTQRSMHTTYKMAAVIYDRHGIYAWGWNHLEKHAEEHAISRANRQRLSGSTIVVAGMKPSGDLIISRPCPDCFARIIKRQLNRIMFFNGEIWVMTRNLLL